MSYDAIHQGVLRALLAAQAAHPALTARDISDYFERAVLGARINAAFALDGENLTAALRHELEPDPAPGPEDWGTMPIKLHTFTAMCREDSGVGSTWVDTVEAADPAAAAVLAAQKCAIDWGQEDGACGVQVVALFLGDVQVVAFDDETCLTEGGAASALWPLAGRLTLPAVAEPTTIPEDWGVIQQALTEAADSRDDWAEDNADDPSWRTTAARYRQLAAGPQPGTVLEVEGETRVTFCARRARALLVLGYDVQDEEDLGTALANLLADLRHFADAQDIDFFGADHMARDHYGAERNDG